MDFAGPLRYRKKPKTEGKAYILLYDCSLTRAVYVDLVPNLETTEFIFVSGSKWIEQVMKDQKISGFPYPAGD